MKYETVIGLEVHAQLSTASKLFSAAATAVGSEANEQACEIDLALPGTLPVLNKAVIELALKLGLSINAEINQHSVFARKNYFYPDLPKGYQISQFDQPIIGTGSLSINLSNGTEKTIGITRAHLEEDAGKSVHDLFKGQSAVDLNRAGTPLLEIVSEPDFRSAEEAIRYLKKLRQLLRWHEICDGNMQEGSFRCDVNISLRPIGASELGTRAEIKNLNSFRFIENAIAYEIERQSELLANGEDVVQETRLYNPDSDSTRSMRSKEDAPDYRYFPDPDLLPVKISDETIDNVRQHLLELPWVRQQRLIDDYGLKPEDAEQLCLQRANSDYFLAVVEHSNTATPKAIVNWLNGEINAYLNKHHITIEAIPVPSQQLACLCDRVADNTVSLAIAKDIFATLWQHGGEVDQIIRSQDLAQVSDSDALSSIIDEIIANNPKQVEQYRSGKDKLFSFFVGQVMKATKGKANPKQVSQLLQEKLKP
jgi:aspartyl-tRNA(Asn)/glutamyl-tRNA(Gln) amidotransferase subunit B